MFHKEILKSLDFVIISCILILFTIGMLAIASATKAFEGDLSHVRMQGIAFVSSVFVLLFIINLDYNVFKNLTPYLYAVLIIPLILLVAVPSLGHSTYGATRWFKIGPVQILVCYRQVGH